MNVVFLFLLLSIGGVFAQGPPSTSPPATLYGTVRTADGAVIDDGFAMIVLFADGLEVTRVLLAQDPVRSENYRLSVPTTTGDEDGRTYSVKLESDGVLSEIDTIPAGGFDFQPSPGGLDRYDFFEAVASDLDGDDLPDSWEAGFGGDFLRNGDPDFDGLTNYEEFRAGTNPTDFESQINFKIVRELADGRIEIAFDAVSDRRYELEAAETLSEWDVLAEHAATTDERVTLTVAAAGFYRITIP